MCHFFFYHAPTMSTARAINMPCAPLNCIQVAAILCTALAGAVYTMHTPYYELKPHGGINNKKYFVRKPVTIFRFTVQGRGWQGTTWTTFDPAPLIPIHTRRGSSHAACPVRSGMPHRLWS